MQMKFELINFDVTVEYINHYTTPNPLVYIRKIVNPLETVPKI